jgi:DNA-binding CsgD family transcriptional regulator
MFELATAVPQPAFSGAQLCRALTPRETEVLRWLSSGKSDRDIGAILGISPRTVHKHLQRIYEKLGVECRTAAVVRALPFLQKTP